MSRGTTARDARSPRGVNDPTAHLLKTLPSPTVQSVSPAPASPAASRPLISIHRSCEDELRRRFSGADRTRAPRGAGTLAPYTPGIESQKNVPSVERSGRKSLPDAYLPTVSENRTTCLRITHRGLRKANHNHRLPRLRRSAGPVQHRSDRRVMAPD